MKKRFRKIPRVQRLHNVQRFIDVLQKLLYELEKNGYIHFFYGRWPVVNGVINTLKKEGIVKHQFAPPWYLQEGHYKDYSTTVLKETTFINKPY